MLFGSQFLAEVYADDDKSMSRVSINPVTDLKPLPVNHGKKPSVTGMVFDRKNGDFLSP